MTDSVNKKANNSSPLTIEIVTLFPEYFEGAVRQSIVGRALSSDLFTCTVVNLRDFGLGAHKVVDDAPFGGGGGMTLALEPLTNCLKQLGYTPREKDQKSASATTESNNRLILTSAAGKPFNQNLAVEYSLLEKITIVCGHYLGVDERLQELFDIEELSLGDYVLTGGEPAALVMVDAIVRLLPGALGNFSSALSDSHQEGLLGAPVYTRPEEFMGRKAPAELLSGDHRLVENFRRLSAIRKTARMRPDIYQTLVSSGEISAEEKTLTDKAMHSA